VSGGRVGGGCTCCEHGPLLLLVPGGVRAAVVALVRLVEVGGQLRAGCHGDALEPLRADALDLVAAAVGADHRACPVALAAALPEYVQVVPLHVAEQVPAGPHLRGSPDA
jgi:hypothetical protein